MHVPVSILSQPFIFRNSVRQRSLHISGIGLTAERIRTMIAAIFLLAAIPLGVFTSWGMPTYRIIVPAVILMQFYLIRCFRNVQMLMILTLYLQIYFLYLVPYFYFGTELSQYSEFQNPVYFGKIAFLFYLFYTGLVCSARKPFNPSRIALCRLIRITTPRYKQVLYLLFLFVALGLVLRQGQNVLTAEVDSYGVYIENLDNTNSLPLFYILFLMIGHYVIADWRWRKLLTVVLIVMLTGYCVTRGFRMILAPTGLLIFMLFVDQRIRTRTVLLLFGLGFVALILVNSLKMSLSFSLDGMFSEGQHDYIVAHHADNLYVAAAGMGMLDCGRIAFFDRVLLNLGFLAETVIPPGMLPDALKYPHIITHTVSTGGGGLFVMGAYLMWGYAGICIFGFLLGEFVRRTYQYRKPLQAIVCAVLMVFAPRWISYDFHIILRFSCLAVVIYLLLCPPRKFS